MKVCCVSTGSATASVMRKSTERSPVELGYPIQVACRGTAAVTSVQRIGEAFSAASAPPFSAQTYLLDL